jgi:hypothetical protein
MAIRFEECTWGSVGFPEVQVFVADKNNTKMASI